MDPRPFAYIGIPFLYLLFAVTSAFAGIVGLLSLATGRTEPIARIARAMDVLAAAQLSVFFPAWSGRRTVSAECGRTDCRFCRALCKALELLERDHCAKEGAKE